MMRYFHIRWDRTSYSNNRTHSAAAFFFNFFLMIYHFFYAKLLNVDIFVRVQRIRIGKPPVFCLHSHKWFAVQAGDEIGANLMDINQFDKLSV